MNHIKKKPARLTTPFVMDAMYETIKLGLFIYGGCLLGSVGLPYLLGDHSILDQAGSFAYFYAIGTLFSFSFMLSVKLFKESQMQGNSP